MSGGQLYRGDRRTPERPIGALETIALAVAAVGVMAIWMLQFTVVPRFALMFRDFGGELPVPTRLVIVPVVAGVTTLLTLVLALVGATLREERIRTVLLVLAALTPLVAAALTFVALYLPIVALASDVS